MRTSPTTRYPEPPQQPALRVVYRAYPATGTAVAEGATVPPVSWTRLSLVVSNPPGPAPADAVRPASPYGGAASARPAVPARPQSRMHNALLLAGVSLFVAGAAAGMVAATYYVLSCFGI